MAQLLHPREVLWRLRLTGRTHSLVAEFGQGRTVVLEIMGRRTWQGLPNRFRVTCGETVVAVDHTGYCSFQFFSNGPTVVWTWTDMPRAAHLRLAEQAELLIVADSVAGYWLQMPHGPRLVRHAPAWKDSHLAERIEWVSYMHEDPVDWPLIGLASALIYVPVLADADIAARESRFS